MKDSNSGGRVGAPIKIPLNFFRISAQSDDLIDELEFRFGHIGVTFFIRIQKLIYGEKGFYYPLDISDESEWVYTLRKTNFEARDKHKIRGILQFLIDRGFFDAHYLSTKKILTSNEIQTFYFWATKRRLLANFNKDYFLPGIEEFIKKVRKIDDEVADEIEELIEKGEGVYESVNKIIQNAEEDKIGIPVSRNSEDENMNPISVDANQTKEKKRNEKKRKGVAFEFSEENSPPISHSSVLPKAPSNDVGEEGEKPPSSKKRAIPEEHRHIFIKSWEDFTGLVFTQDFDKNSAIVRIVQSATAFCMKMLDGKALTDEQKASILPKQLDIVFRNVLNNDMWKLMPPTINSHRDIVRIGKIWDTLLGFVINKQNELNDPNSKISKSRKTQNQPTETRKDQPRINGAKSIQEIAQRSGIAGKMDGSPPANTA